MHFLHIGENIVLAISIWYKEWSSQVIYTTLGGEKRTLRVSSLLWWVLRNKNPFLFLMGRKTNTNS